MLKQQHRLTVQQGCLLLELGLQSLKLPQRTHYGNHEFVVRQSSHVTLVGYGHRFTDRVRAEFSLHKDEAESVTNTYLKEAAKGISFEVRLGETVRYARKQYSKPVKHTRHTLVIMCEVEGAQEFYRRIQAATGVEVNPPPFHITIYTANDRNSMKGVELVNHNDLGAFTIPLGESDVPDILDALRQHRDRI